MKIAAAREPSLRLSVPRRVFSTGSRRGDDARGRAIRQASAQGDSPSPARSHSGGSGDLSGLFFPPMSGRTALCRRLVFCFFCNGRPTAPPQKKMPFRTSGVSFEKSALGEGRGVWGEEDPLPLQAGGSLSPQKRTGRRDGTLCPTGADIWRKWLPRLPHPARSR